MVQKFVKSPKGILEKEHINFFLREDLLKVHKKMIGCRQRMNFFPAPDIKYEMLQARLN